MSCEKNNVITRILSFLFKKEKKMNDWKIERLERIETFNKLHDLFILDKVSK